MTDLFVLSGWTVGVFGAFLVVVCVLAFVPSEPGGKGGPIARVAVVLIAALVGSIVIDYLGRHDRDRDRRALDARVGELAARTTIPGSALACLDAMAGDAVESSCEKALFATPEATASAVSYVAAQLSLLASGIQHAQHHDPGYETTLTNLRRALERDRFGIVAQVLAVRDGCTPAQCDAFAMLRDTRRVRANMAERRYASMIERHVAGWAPADRSVAAHAPPALAEAPAIAGEAGAKPPNNLFFPSSASIPAVNIMSAEPSAAPETLESAEAATPPMPPRKPAQARTRPPANNATAVPAAPLPLAPNGP